MMSTALETGRPDYIVHQGDMLKVAPTLPEQSIDMLLTDIPYSSGGQYRGDRMARTSAKYVNKASSPRPDFAGDNRDQRSFVLWASICLAECMPLLKPGAIVASFIDWRQLPVLTDAFQVAGLVLRGIVPWVKPSARPQQGRPAQDAEFIVWGTLGPRPLEGKPGPGSYTGMPPSSSKRMHQTEKPIALLKQWCQMAPKGGVILDPFCGSGSTGVAAVATGRRFIGIELDPHYAEVARNRCSNTPVDRETGQQSLGVA